MPFSERELWGRWMELAAHEVDLEQKFKPLVEDHAKTHAKRISLENFICNEYDKISPQDFADKWRELVEKEKLPFVEQKREDAAFDIFCKKGSPMHYTEVLKELKNMGVSIGGRDPGATLVAYLGRDKRFAKAPEAGRGFWQLKQWQE